MSRWAWLLVLILAGVDAAVATAHVLTVESKTDRGRLEVVASFNANLPADGATVELRTQFGELVVEGVTDENGVWVTALPRPGRYNLIVRAFGNHSRTVELEVRPDSASSERATGWVAKAAVVGGVLAAWVALLFWLRRRRRKAISAEEPRRTPDLNGPTPDQ
jgi:hypothetical protein